MEIVIFRLILNRLGNSKNVFNHYGGRNKRWHMSNI